MKEKKPYPIGPEDLTSHIMRTATILRRRAELNRYTNELHKVTGQNGWILCFIRDCEDLGIELHQKDIEERFSITKSTVSKVIKGMESKNLIRRDSGSGDARFKVLKLTDTGRELSDHITEEHDEIERQIRNNFTDDEILLLEQLLDKVTYNIFNEK